MEKGYRNLWLWMALLIPMTFFGFYKTYFSEVPNFSENNDSRIHWHTLVAAVWTIMLIIQPLLIKLERRKLHNLIGKASYLIFPALIVTLIITTMKSHDKGNNLVMPIANIVLISIFYVLAIWKRRNTPAHMRYMIGIALVFVTPTLGRILIFYAGLGKMGMVTILYTVINFLILFLLMADIKRDRDFRPYLVVLIGFLLYQISLYVF